MEPFSSLIDKIEKKVRNDQEQGNARNELLILCWTQLRSLAALYYFMSQFDLMSETKKIGTPDFSFQRDKYGKVKSIIDYFSFVNILNQFGVALKKHQLTIPRYERIKFFRNKVSEHWQDYSESGFVGAQTQTIGEIAVPNIASAYSPDERVAVKDEIDKILTSLGLSLDVGDPKIGNIVDQPGNAEKVYLLLETIDPTLKKMERGTYKIPDRLIELLFQSGFPVPISNVSEYCGDLTTYLEANLDLEVNYTILIPEKM